MKLGSFHMDVGSGVSLSYTWGGYRTYVGFRKVYSHSEGKHDLRWRFFKRKWVSYNKKIDWSWP